MPHRTRQRDPRPRGRSGLTLMELLVSVAILAMIALAFSSILGTSQQVVTESQKMMRANAQAEAIANVFRPDFREATRQGMLAIAQEEDGARPMLVMTAARVNPSMTGGSSLASLVTLGLANYRDRNDEPVKALYRQGWLLGPDAGSSGDGSDVLDLDLSEITAMERMELFEWLDSMLVGETAPTPKFPAESLSDVQDLWQIVSPHCVALSLMWTDGTYVTHGGRKELQWYGIEYEMTPSDDDEYDVEYVVKAKDERDGEGYDDTRWRNDGHPNRTIQFPYDPVRGEGYVALWSHHDQSNWPTAIKLRFRLVDSTLPEGLRISADPWDDGEDYDVGDRVSYKGSEYVAVQTPGGGSPDGNDNWRVTEPGTDYEIICPVGQ